ncbi:MAG: DUF2461 domain-containing protein [Christensenellales bacterium]|jgi:uncharacterized protein (TIGR02453 family)
MAFKGFRKETFEFLMRVRFNNEKQWFESNRAAFEEYVKEPLAEFGRHLAPFISGIDPSCETRPVQGKAMSRIYRDTRYSSDKSPLRDHMWLAYKYPGQRTSESFCFYFGISPEGARYGLGMYSAFPSMMEKFRLKMAAQPSRFLEASEKAERIFTLYGEDYRRRSMPDKLPSSLGRYYLKKYFHWRTHAAPNADMMSGEIAETVIEHLSELVPVYRFLMLEEA